MANQWESVDLVTQYAGKLDEVDWYEYDVNLPSLLKLLPKVPTLLDFGCGPGQFTKRLSEDWQVTGADSSKAMLDIATQAYPEIDFVAWDGQSPYPNTDIFDIVFSKLTLQFVEDLELFAAEVKTILNPHGVVVFSVPHPVRQMRALDGEYAPRATFDAKIGGYGLVVQMIHRPIGEYVQPFLDQGFVLCGLEEPLVSEELQVKHDAPEMDLHKPKRLNLAFRLTN
jgi:SAM-dependent methyltransferase